MACSFYSEEHRERTLKEFEPVIKPPKALFWIWGAFFDLDSERSIGMGGKGRIPVTKIYEYCDRLGYSNGAKDLFIHCIKMMDNKFMILQCEQVRIDKIRRENEQKVRNGKKRI